MSSFPAFCVDISRSWDRMFVCLHWIHLACWYSLVQQIFTSKKVSYGIFSELEIENTILVIRSKSLDFYFARYNWNWLLLKCKTSCPELRIKRAPIKLSSIQSKFSLCMRLILTHERATLCLIGTGFHGVSKSIQHAYLEAPSIYYFKKCSLWALLFTCVYVLISKIQYNQKRH